MPKEQTLEDITIAVAKGLARMVDLAVAHGVAQGQIDATLKGVRKAVGAPVGKESTAAAPKRRGRPPGKKAKAPKAVVVKAGSKMTERAQAVMDYLKAAGDTYVPAQTIGDSLKLSRVTVALHIKRLRKDGVKISSKPRLGYKFGGVGVAKRMLKSVPADAPVAAPKRRGRPPKAAAAPAAEAPAAAPKRRGRPPKVAAAPVEAVPVAPKRRGRPPKVKVVASPAIEPVAAAVVPKRRGRPPKAKPVPEEGAPAPAVEAAAPVVKKRRGRPPKVKPVGENGASAAPVDFTPVIVTPEEAAPAVSADTAEKPAEDTPVGKKRGRKPKLTEDTIVARLQSAAAAGQDMAYGAVQVRDPELFAASEKVFGSYREALVRSQK